VCVKLCINLPQKSQTLANSVGSGVNLTTALSWLSHDFLKKTFLDTQHVILLDIHKEFCKI
jgi:hypothetical protein